MTGAGRWVKHSLGKGSFAAGVCNCQRLQIGFRVQGAKRANANEVASFQKLRMNYRPHVVTLILHTFLFLFKICK